MEDETSRRAAEILNEITTELKSAKLGAGINLGYKYTDKGRILTFIVNPSWPKNIREEITKIIAGKVSKNREIISSIEVMLGDDDDD